MKKHLLTGSAVAALIAFVFIMTSGGNDQGQPLIEQPLSSLPTDHPATVVRTGTKGSSLPMELQEEMTENEKQIAAHKVRKEKRRDYLTQPREAYAISIENTITDARESGNKTEAVWQEKRLEKYLSSPPFKKSLMDINDLIARQQSQRKDEMKTSGPLASYATPSEQRAREAAGKIKGGRGSRSDWLNLADFLNEVRDDALNPSGQLQYSEWYQERIAWVDELANTLSIPLDAENEEWAAVRQAEAASEKQRDTDTAFVKGMLEINPDFFDEHSDPKYLAILNQLNN